jgi:hypothetical protein
MNDLEFFTECYLRVLAAMIGGEGFSTGPDETSFTIARRIALDAMQEYKKAKEEFPGNCTHVGDPADRPRSS